MTTIKETQEDIVAEFEMLGTDWQEKYAHIMQMARGLEPLPEEYQTDKYKVKGCQSSVWLVPEFREGKVFFKVDSDSLLVKGLAAMMMRVFSGHTSDEILAADMDFLQEIGLDTHLSPTRKNGLGAMARQIKLYALAGKAMQ